MESGLFFPITEPHSKKLTGGRWHISWDRKGKEESARWEKRGATKQSLEAKWEGPRLFQVAGVQWLSAGVIRIAAAACCVEHSPRVSSMPALCRKRGPPGNPFPDPLPIYRYCVRPVISSTFHGSPPWILTTNLAGGCDYHPCTNRDKSTERLSQGRMVAKWWRLRSTN